MSHHPRDVAEGYCGHCHDWTGSASEAVDLLRLRHIARAELAGESEWRGLIVHARACAEKWCINYARIYDEVASRVSRQ